MISIEEIKAMLKANDTVTVQFFYKKEASDAKRYFIAAGYDCYVERNEFANFNYLYFLTIKKQVK